MAMRRPLHLPGVLCHILRRRLTLDVNQYMYPRFREKYVRAPNAKGIKSVVI